MSLLQLFQAPTPGMLIVGTPGEVVTAGPVTLVESGGGGEEQFILPDSIASAEAFGTPKINLTIFPSSITSAEAFGALTMLPGAVTIQLVGIGTEEQFGTLEIVGGQDGPGDLCLAYGQFTYGGGCTYLPQTVSPDSISSEEAFGTLKVNLTIFPDSIASGEAFGTPIVLPGEVIIIPDSISSAEAFGTPQINMRIFVDGIASGEAFGTPTIEPGEVIIQPDSIASEEAFGSPQLNLIIYLDGIPSEEAFGEFQIGLRVRFTDVEQIIQVVERLQSIGVISVEQMIQVIDTTQESAVEEMFDVIQGLDG